MPDLVIGVDCSTTAAKAVVWDAQGRHHGEGRSAFDVDRPHPGWGEQHAPDWWDATRAAIRDAVREVEADQVRAISVTHQRETFVCLDERDDPVRPAMLWLDMRATAQVDEHGSEQVHRTSGKPPNATAGWYKLLWLREHEPDTLRRTSRVVDVQGYLAHKLTGNWRTCWASADPMGVLDMASFRYDDDLIGQAGLAPDQFSEVVAPGELLGELADDVAHELGLTAGLPIVAAAGDGQSAGLGCNVTGPGRAYLNLGSGVVSGTHSDDYTHAEAYRTMTSGVAGAYVLETFIGGGSLNVSWFVRELSDLAAAAESLHVVPEDLLEAAARQVPPGSDGLLALPYLTGALTPWWDNHARGAFVGLTESHGRPHLYRAILEGIAFEQRLLYDGVEEAVRAPIEEVITLGGGSRSPLWNQILADVLRRPIAVASQQESTALGAGILAAVAAGLHADVRDAAEAMTGTSRTYEPDEEQSQRYDAVVDVYRDLYPALRGLYPRLVEAAG